MPEAAPQPTAVVRLFVLRGITQGPGIPAYARERPDAELHQRLRLEANAALVIVWSEAAGVPPDAGAWRRRAGGAPLPPAPEPRVSLSHAGDLAAVATCHGADVGVDVERPRPGRDLARVASAALAASELSRWLATPHDASEDAFMRAWTAKEAVLKALGTGLAGGLRSVVLDAGGALVELPEQAGETAGWTLVRLELDGGWGAVAVRHPAARVELGPLERLTHPD